MGVNPMDVQDAPPELNLGKRGGFEDNFESPDRSLAVELSQDCPSTMLRPAAPKRDAGEVQQGPVPVTGTARELNFPRAGAVGAVKLTLR